MALALAGGTGCPGDDIPAVETTGEDSTSEGTTTGVIPPTTTPNDTTEGMDTTAGETCGNGAIDEGEDCDGTELGGADCAGQGFVDGELACNADCTFDTTACVESVCGNGMVEGKEACDGDALGDADCLSLGYDEGTLACGDDCAFDESMCVTWACNNGIIEGPEVCDDIDLGGQDCVTQGFDGGTLACNAKNCRSFDTAACYACGDDVIGGPEVCDGTDLAGQDCVTLGFVGGTLACAAGCGAYDTSACQSPSAIVLMGDDTTDPAEWDIYRNALTAAGRTWSEINLDTAAFPTLVELQAYDAVIWFDELTIAAGNAEAQIVADWLTDGNERDLFMTGVDFLWDFENDPPGSGEDNLYLLLGMAYQGDFAGTTIPTLDGIAGDPITGPFVAPDGLVLSMDPNSNGDYINATGAGTVAATYAAGGVGGGFYGLGHYDAGTYQVVWLGVSFHAGLADAAQRDQLMANVVAWLGV